MGSEKSFFAHGMDWKWFAISGGAGRYMNCFEAMDDGSDRAPYCKENLKISQCNYTLKVEIVSIRGNCVRVASAQIKVQTLNAPVLYLRADKINRLGWTKWIL